MKTAQLFRQYTALDLILHSFGQMLAQFHQQPLQSLRPVPTAPPPEQPLSPTEQHQSACLMRVDHAGEICAQGLYLGQALCARDPKLKQQLLEAALQEEDHMAWCQWRLLALNSHPSYLSPLWYGGAMMIGIAAGLCSDGASLGFLEETEHQVVQHLEEHLRRLPNNDEQSRVILETMQAEEALHASNANTAGSTPLPWPIPSCMRWTAKIMTSTAYYL